MHRQAVDGLIGDSHGRELSRRELLARAAALGVSASALTGMVSGVGAQEATPPLQLGDFSGRKLRLSVALAEDEADDFQEVVIDGFKNATGGDVELIKIEAADVIRTLQAQVESGNIEIDMLT
jgi:ABC-type glycerol-3-phosphate transport system substrate-binding protein